MTPTMKTLKSKNLWHLIESSDGKDTVFFVDCMALGRLKLRTAYMDYDQALDCFYRQAGIESD